MLLENLIKANPENQNLLLLLTEIYFTLGEYQKFKLALSSISQNTPYSTAKKFYWEAYNYLQEGDLLSASENLSKAVKIFHKNAYFYEEAEAHLLMGTIYRICAVEDVSLFMFKTAQKIFCMENLFFCNKKSPLSGTFFQNLYSSRSRLRIRIRELLLLR